MILIDTSAWIEFLRDTGSPTRMAVDRMLGAGIATADPIVMEVLAGARDDGHARDLRRLLGRAALLRCESADFESAALLYRRYRARGATVRSLTDCPIASVAMRAQVALLHANRDFDAIAQHSPLHILDA